jgi:hypothetical protein
MLQGLVPVIPSKNDASHLTGESEAKQMKKARCIQDMMFSKWYWAPDDQL